MRTESTFLRIACKNEVGIILRFVGIPLRIGGTRSPEYSYAKLACMFAFCNRRRTLIKILQWDGSGFWILMKRLDRNSFHWPDTPDELRKVTLKEIHWLCDGLSQNPSGAFEERHPKIVV